MYLNYKRKLCTFDAAMSEKSLFKPFAKFLLARNFLTYTIINKYFDLKSINQNYRIHC